LDVRCIFKKKISVNKHFFFIRLIKV